MGLGALMPRSAHYRKPVARFAAGFFSAVLDLKRPSSVGRLHSIAASFLQYLCQRLFT